MCIRDSIETVHHDKAIKTNSKLYKIAKVPVKFALKLHKEMCPNFTPSVQLSLDGVTEPKSNTISLDVYSTKFSDCRHIYPHQIIRPVQKYQLPPRPQLSTLVQSLQNNSLTITNFVGDNPKKVIIREALCRSAKYACEYCNGAAERSTKITPEDELSCRNKKNSTLRNK